MSTPIFVFFPARQSKVNSMPEHGGRGCGRGLSTGRREHRPARSPAGWAVGEGPNAYSAQCQASAPVGQALVQAGESPARTRSRQPWHFSIFSFGRCFPVGRKESAPW